MKRGTIILIVIAIAVIQMAVFSVIRIQKLKRFHGKLKDEIGRLRSEVLQNYEEVSVLEDPAYNLEETDAFENASNLFEISTSLETDDSPVAIFFKQEIDNPPIHIFHHSDKGVIPENLPNEKGKQSSLQPSDTYMVEKHSIQQTDFNKIDRHEIWDRVKGIELSSFLKEKIIFKAFNDGEYLYIRADWTDIYPVIDYFNVSSELTGIMNNKVTVRGKTFYFSNLMNVNEFISKQKRSFDIEVWEWWISSDGGRSNIATARLTDATVNNTAKSNRRKTRFAALDERSAERLENSGNSYILPTEGGVGFQKYFDTRFRCFQWAETNLMWLSPSRPLTAEETTSERLLSKDIFRSYDEFEGDRYKEQESLSADLEDAAVSFRSKGKWTLVFRRKLGVSNNTIGFKSGDKMICSFYPSKPGRDFSNGILLEIQ